MGKGINQIPGKLYTFIKKTGEKDTGILPDTYGQENDFAYWLKKKESSSGGMWKSKLFRGSVRLDHGKLKIPGQSYTFVDKRTGETETVVLPSVYGESDKFVKWNLCRSHTAGGYWASRRFSRRSTENNAKGTGPSGLLGRMRYLLRRQNQVAKNKNYKAPDTTPEKMVDLWLSQKGVCAFCNEHLELLESALDHEHSLGAVRGFVHIYCNLAEGSIAKMTDKQFENFVIYMRKLRS